MKLCNRYIIISIGVFCFSISLSGCNTIQNKDITKYTKRLENERTHKNPLITNSNKDKYPEDKKPIIKIISGEETSGIKDAYNRLSDKYKKESSVGSLNNSLKQNDKEMNRIISSISLRQVPVKNIAEILTSMTGFNIVATRDAAEVKVDLFIKNLTLRQTIDALARLNGLWFREDENIVTLMTQDEYAKEIVIRRSEKTRAYNLRYTNASDIAKVICVIMGNKIDYSDIGQEKTYGYINKDDAKETNLSATKSTDKTILTEADKKQLLQKGITQKNIDAVGAGRILEKPLPAVMTVFKRNNSIIVRSLDDRVLNEVEKIIGVLDTPTNQVLYELRIMQITLDDGFESFFQFKRNSSSGDRTKSYGTLANMVGIASDTLNFSFADNAISARIQFFADNNKVNTLATPFLMCANNSSVSFFVGDETPLRKDITTKTIFDDDGNIVQTLFETEVEMKELGTTIEISSFINDDGTITMNFDADISTAKYNVTQIIVSSDDTGQEVLYPIDGVEKSTLKTIISGRPGQTLVIGGIIRENVQDYETKVPLLGDVPVVGNLFKKISKSNVKTETIMLLTPHIIEHPGNVEEVGDKFISKSSSHPIIESKAVVNQSDLQSDGSVQR